MYFHFPYVLANPILKADKAQLERWKLKASYVNGISENHPAKINYLMVRGYIFDDSQVRLEVKDIANPTVKMHLQKMLGVPTTKDFASPEAIARGKKVFSKK